MEQKTVRIACQAAATLPLETLVAFQGTLKTLPPENAAKLRREIIEMGFSAPFHVWKCVSEKMSGTSVTNYVLDGHQRLVVLAGMAADGYTIPPLPVAYIEAADEAESKRKLLAIASSYGHMSQQSLAEYLEAAGIEFDEAVQRYDLPDVDFESMREMMVDGVFTSFDDDKFVGKTEPDSVPINVPQIVHRGEIWKLGKHKLVCCDSTNEDTIKKFMKDTKADCVFTSPPYGVGVEYRSYEDTIKNLRSMIPSLAKIWLSVVVPGGYAVINFGDLIKGRDIVKTDEPCEYPMAIEYWPVFRKLGWLLWSRRVWCKPCAGTGSMQCISSNRASTNWEHIWTWKTPGKPIHDKQTVGDFASQNGWIDSTHVHKLEVGLDVHGAGMPVFVAEYCVSTHSIRGNVVYEPFSGTGTTIIACEKTGRICFASEIDEQYCNIAIERWQQFTGKVAERLI